MLLNDPSPITRANECRKIQGLVTPQQRQILTEAHALQQYLSYLVDRIDILADDLSRLKPIDTPDSEWQAKHARFDSMVAVVPLLHSYRKSLMDSISQVHK